MNKLQINHSPEEDKVLTENEGTEIKTKFAESALLVMVLVEAEGCESVQGETKGNRF